MLEGNSLSEMGKILPKALQFSSSPDAPRAQCDAEVFSFDHCSHSTCPGKVSLPQPSTHQFSQGRSFPYTSSHSPSALGRMSQLLTQWRH